MRCAGLLLAFLPVLHAFVLSPRSSRVAEHSKSCAGYSSPANLIGSRITESSLASVVPSMVELPTFGGVGLFNALARLIVGAFLCLNHDHESVAKALPPFLVEEPDPDDDKCNDNCDLRKGLLHPLIGFAIVFVIRNSGAPLTDAELGLVLLGMAATPCALGLVPGISDFLDRIFFVPICPTWDKLSAEDVQERMAELKQELSLCEDKLQQRESEGAPDQELNVRKSEIEARKCQIIELEHENPVELRKVLSERTSEHKDRLAAGAPNNEIEAWEAELTVRTEQLDCMETELRARTAEIGWKQWFTVLAFLLTLQVFLESILADHDADAVLRDCCVLWVAFCAILISKIRREAKEDMIAEDRRFGIQAWHLIVVVALWDALNANPIELVWNPILAIFRPA